MKLFTIKNAISLTVFVGVLAITNFKGAHEMDIYITPNSIKGNNIENIFVTPHKIAYFDHFFEKISVYKGIPLYCYKVAAGPTVGEDAGGGEQKYSNILNAKKLASL